ncbi:MAG TPA: T9SS type A sorting domain-containing protein [Saprospiraceae bacterium]|nr:T9SS type A sorting domain-containing protein [Saprospiraceae bacterium]HMU03828.1 T9SS type A sorting domain-containing protein [Saprospiraceae bacterium]
MIQIIKRLFTIAFILGIIQGVNSQTASFIEGIKNDWSFFTDRIIYADNSGIFYRLNNDTKLYYSDGTTAGTKATGYFFGTDVFLSPDLSVFTHDDNYTALGTNSSAHDIIIFKDKSPVFEYVEKTVGAFKGMTFYNGKLYYIFAPTGTKSTKLMEYDPVTKVKKELLTFDSNGAFGISVLNGKLMVIGYKNGNKLLSIDPSSGAFTSVYTFNATNSFATNVNMMVTNDKLYFWYPNGTSAYSLYVTEGKENTTIPLIDNLEAYDPFVYYAYNVMKVGGGKIIARVKEKNNFNKNFAYFSDGTIAGTTKIQYKEVQNLNPYDFEYYCDQFYFSALDENGESKLFSTDGSSEGTNKLSNIEIGSLVKFNNRLYLNAEVNQSKELYAWDEETNQIVFVLDVNNMARDSDPREFATTKDKLFMAAIKSNLDISYNLAVMTEPTRLIEQCATSSIDDKVLHDISISPNPFNAGFIISKEDSDASYNITVSDLMGRIIMSQVDVKFPFEISGLDWASGMYVVKIASSNQASKSIRLIKSH